MKKYKITAVFMVMVLLTIINMSIVNAQIIGTLPRGSVSKHIFVSNGPKGPIHGGESAVTEMVLMKDGWVYGSTKATLGGENCHIFRTDGDTVQHLLNITSKLKGQTAISDIAIGEGGILIGCTSTYDEIFDTKDNSYDGGHLFSYDPETKSFEDLGIIAAGQGINCIALDVVHHRIYGVTYPAGHLFCYDTKSKAVKDFGEVMTPWKVKDYGVVTWRGVPKVLIIDDAGTVYYSGYYRRNVDIAAVEKMKGASNTLTAFTGGRIYRLAYGDDKPVYTGANIPTQAGMESDPLYENGIASVIRATDGGFWCGTINDGFLFKFIPSTSTVINKGKAFQYWNLKSLAYGGNGKLYMLGGRDEDIPWLMCYDAVMSSINSLGWHDNASQSDVICADKKGRILIAENLRHSMIWVYEGSK